MTQILNKRRNILILIAFLANILMPSSSMYARHVRAYCFMADDSLAVYEDSCVILSLVFGQNEGFVTANIYNKTDKTIYLRGYGSTASTNGEQCKMVELADVSAFPLQPHREKRIHGWTLLVQKLDEDVLDVGKCRNFLQWAPGHKGSFVDRQNGSRTRFKKGLCKKYTPQDSPLRLVAHVVYSTSKTMEQFYTAEASLYVSDIAIGRRHGPMREDPSIPSELYGRRYFSFDSGGCDALPYAGGVVMLSAGAAVAGVFILAVAYIESKLEEE